MTLRTALIVGASRGLGLGLARELAARGWRVMATVRSPDPAPGLLAAAREFEGRVVQIESIDILQPAGLDALAQRLAGESIDLLLVNAGISGPRDQSVETVSSDELTHIMFTNAIAPLRVARRLLPRVKEGGTVAFMSSRMGSIAENETGGMDLYRASKAALNSFTRGFAATDAKSHGVGVLTLHPGWVRTDMGGAEAPLSIDESVRGLADVLERGASPQHRFLDYTGRQLAW
jgi:NAD(P)-dependent dehydrogenase (short-subunit alcohol dehydrogenase family)